MNGAMLPWIAVWCGQIALLVTIAAAAAAALRLRIAAIRYPFWQAVVAACLLLPVVPVFIAAPTGTGIVGPSAPALAAPASIVVATAAAQPSFSRIALAILVGGALLRTVWLVLGFLQLHALGRHGDAGEVDAFADLRAAIAPHADIRWNDRIAQPATFGARHPVVLLPARLRELPPAAQRAVVAHELVHVARRDWLWLPVEEAVRTAFWFHPFVRWALAQIHLGREQLVDARVVRHTGVRDAYMAALLHFADSPAGRAPAIPFIRPRHLAARLRALAKEEVMSIRKAAILSVLSSAVVAAGAWSLTQMLPLPLLAAQVGAATVNETGPLKRATTVVNAEYPAEARGLGILADVSVGVTVAPSGEVIETKAVSWGYHVSGDDSQARDAFLAAEPINKRFVAVAEQAARQWRFDAGASEWKTGIRFEFRALGQHEEVTVSSPNAVPPPAPAPGEPLRVGGGIKAPRVLTRTKPYYTQEALKARVEGTVILEVTVDHEGHVSNAKVLRSIPMLDQAAIDTVREWTFEPTLLNGAPVDVSMVVTLNFTLS